MFRLKLTNKICHMTFSMGYFPIQTATKYIVFNVKFMLSSLSNISLRTIRQKPSKLNTM